MSGQYTVYHLHSDLSNGVTNIDSVTKYGEYIAKAKECGMNAMGFSEHGSVFEWWHKKSAIEAAGMKYIHAVECYLTTTLTEKIRDNYHCVLLAKNYSGFLELNRLVSNSFCRKDNHFYYAPRITFDELFHTSDNILVTTACVGGVLGKGDEQVQRVYLDFLTRNRHRCFLEVGHHMDEKQISYTSVHVNNQTLSVELQSSGEGRCTLDDVKAIQNIYTVIHAQSLADKIRNVKIEIVDRTGTVIYDETEADVSSKVENDLAQTTTADTEIIADRDILQEARNVLADTSYSIQSVNISDAEEITGKCLNLTLTLSNADDSSVSRISSVYDNLESYSLSTGAITQCNITLLNDEQECIAYMIGDFQYGNCIAWISPDYENAFVALEGPQPDN